MAKVQRELTRSYERPSGWIIHLDKIVSKSHFLRYAARYVRRPPIAKWRLLTHGTLWDVHRGGIGGGRKGVGPNLFWQQFPGKWVSVSGDRVACITAIGAPDFWDHVSKFVEFVKQFNPKQAMKAVK